MLPSHRKVFTYFSVVNLNVNIPNTNHCLATSMPSYNFSRLEHLDSLIRVKATGSPKVLAKKLNISVRAVYDYINMLKSLGAPINYNRHKATYYYDEQGHFHFKFIRTED